ncbi:MAG: sodium:solute symporter family protein [Firmicutes bacterium]|nr:sodium:solute symporter family protein [Bacillota bacterium]
MVTNAINVLIICISAFIPLLLGERARLKSTGSIEDFILQNRRLKLVPMYATVFATYMSAFAFMGGIGYFLDHGPIYMTTVGWDMLFAVLFILLGRRIWFYGRRYGYMTATEFFDGIYDSKTLSITVTVITILCTMLYLQAQIAGAVILIEISTGGIISPFVGGLVFFSILVIYLWEGGMRAVAMTDMFYGILIVIAMLSTGFFLIHTAGGAEKVFNDIIDMDPLNVSISRETGKEQIAMWVCLFIVVPVGAFMGPQIWIRNYASSSASNFSVLPILLGISSIICIGTLCSGSASVIMAEPGSEPLEVVMRLVNGNGHPLFYGFVTVGIFAAIFSTANSQVHALAAVYTIDIHKKYVNNKLPSRRLVSLAKWAILVVATISYILMMVMPRNLFDLAVVGMGGIAQLIVPTAGALFWRNSSARAAEAGILSGEAVFIAMMLLVRLDASICAVAGLVVNTAVFVILSVNTFPEVSVSRRIASCKREYDSRDY